MGAGIFGELAEHLVVAVLKEHVRHPRPKAWTRRNGNEMHHSGSIFAPDSNDFDEFGVGEARRLRQCRLGKSDVVVPGKVPHDIERRVTDRRQVAAHLRRRLRVDFPDQPSQHVVE
jgi:hypothetical protein